MQQQHSRGGSTVLAASVTWLPKVQHVQHVQHALVRDGMLRLTTLGKETLNQCAVNGCERKVVWYGVVQWSPAGESASCQGVDFDVHWFSFFVSFLFDCL